MKKSSLTYRFVHFIDSDVPQNICPFVRTLVFGILGCMVLAVMGFCILFNLSYPILYWLGFYHAKKDAMELVILGCLGWSIILIPWIYCSIRKWLKNDQTPSLLRQYLTAIHNKVCSKIEFED